MIGQYAVHNMYGPHTRLIRGIYMPTFETPLMPIALPEP